MAHRRERRDQGHVQHSREIPGQGAAGGFLAKLGDKAGATEAAKQSIAAAAAQGGPIAAEYQRLNETLLATLT
jgi:hypothetical protein